MEADVMMSKPNNDELKRPGSITGLVVGGLITISLIVLFFLGDVLVGLPLLPYDLTDWAARNLDGRLVTFGIDSMVGVIRALNVGDTAVAAKTAEQAVGVLTLFMIGVVAGGILYAWLKREGEKSAYTYGLAIGIMLGVVLAFLSASVNFTATTPTLINFVYIVGVFALWGVALGWIYTDLAALPTAQTLPDSVEQLDRRQFLVRVGGATATLTVVGAGLNLLLRPAERATQTTTEILTLPTPIPPTLTENELEPAFGTRPEYTPIEEHYRIDISSRPPVLDRETWRLEVTGLVEEPVSFTLDDLEDNYEIQDLFITMSCISNWLGGDLISTTRWTGISFQKILDDMKPTAEATYIKITSADGFDEYLSIDLIKSDPTVMLCYAWDGKALEQKHGYPLRVHIPNCYGMKQPKWITGMEFVAAWDEGYWVRRGWSEAAIVRTTSVIDTVAADHTYERDGVNYVPIGGIAYAASRSISRVEVSIDDGEWMEAQLRTPISDRTWVIWRYDWAFTPGTHSFRVRAVDGEGFPQIEEVADVRPDGATGIHRISRVV